LAPGVAPASAAPGAVSSTSHQARETGRQREATKPRTRTRSAHETVGPGPAVLRLWGPVFGGGAR